MLDFLFFSVAPMMDWTDRHCRFFHRLLSRRARLYTEMVTTGAVLHGDRGRLLGFSPEEHPVAVQLGGSDPRELALVGEGVAAMKAAVSIPVTVKCRIGVDDQDAEEALNRLAESVVAAGADALVVHARKAWLQGLSPKENRDVPPLDYGRVHRLKAAHPGLPAAINGGIGSLAEAERHLSHVDGVML